MSALFVTSSLLPVTHGFSIRSGGTSEGPFASLNLGFSVGDDRTKVDENLRRLARAIGVLPASLCTVSQVHGDRLIEAIAPTNASPEGSAESDSVPPPLGEADALWTRTPGVAVGVKTADCVPILLADEKGRRVAAVHSGWKGTDLRIAARAVETLVAHGAQAETLVAAIGPSIGACCYEVSDELAVRFERAFDASVVRRVGTRQHLDLRRAVWLTLTAAGLRADRIDTMAACTACDAENYFSHRRDRGLSGRHLSFVVAQG